MINVIYIKNKEEEQPPIPQTPYEENQFTKNFSAWMDNALAGDKFCYYIGEHVAGNYVGGMAFRLYEQGKLALYQERAGTKFKYWAQRLKEGGHYQRN